MTNRTSRTLFYLSMLVGSAAIAEPIPEIDCLIEPNMTIELSSPVSGVLETILVDRSDAVTQGQVVATLKSDIEQVKVEASKETLNLSRVEQKRATELYRDNALTLSEKEQADHEVVLNELEVEHALANLELRKIRSPIDGVVADRYLMPGEFIEDNPILKLAQLDPLRVEVVAPVTYFNQIKNGMHAQVKTEFGSFEDLVAEVIVVDKVIDAASGTFGIRLELDNKDHQVPGGLKCTVRFFDEQEEAAYLSRHVDENTGLPVSVPAGTEPDGTDMIQGSLCRKIGPFKEKEKVMSLMKAIEDDISSYKIHNEITTTVSYLVTTDTVSSRQAAQTLKNEMKQKGVNDLAIMNRTDGTSIALGLFRNENRAYKRQAAIKKLGYDSRVVPQEKKRTTHWAEVTVEVSEDKLSRLVAASGVKGTDNLLYQSCTTDILASVR
ncbi:MAG: efflux RND transporter periplasmic adaptor subunit [Gammaproteobacteria bacterium]